MMSLTCCFLFFFCFSFCSIFPTVLKPEKAAQARSADWKQVVMGSASSALCTSPTPCADPTDTATPRRWELPRPHTHACATRLSSLRLSQSLRLSLCCDCVVRLGLGRLRNTRTAHKLFGAEIDGVNGWNCWLFLLLRLDRWELNYRHLSRCHPQFRGPPPAPPHHLSIDPSPWNGVTYHEGFRHLGFLSLCSLSTQSALFHQQHAPKASWNQRCSRRQEGEKSPLSFFQRSPVESYKAHGKFNTGVAECRKTQFWCCCAFQTAAIDDNKWSQQFRKKRRS